jgi:uncharacterized protein (TIGR00266 family)
MGSMSEVEFEIYGSEMQFVEISLDPNEAAVGQAGAMMFMDQGIAMESIIGDGSAKKAGFMSSLLSAGKRLIAGESLFMTVFTNTSSQKRKVAFAAPHPGKIVPVLLSEVGGELIVERHSFLAAARGISIELFFQKKIGVGFFGGEGFIMEKLMGDGLCLIHAGGTIVEKHLSASDSLVLDSGCLVAFQPSVTMDIKAHPSLKSMLFSGESVYMTELKGPGKVWIQSLPFSRLMDLVSSFAESRILPKVQRMIAESRAGQN